MADLDYRITYPYNNQEIRIDELLEGVYADRSTGSQFFGLVSSDKYSPNFCYLLQNNKFHYFGMNVYKQYAQGGEAIDLNDFYKIEGKTLGIPVLKGCYPLHPIPNGRLSIQGNYEFSGDNYDSIKIEGQKLYVKPINSSFYEKYIDLPRVIVLEMYGGGGAGGSSKGFTTTGEPYVRMSGGGGSGGFFSSYIDTNHTWIISIGKGGIGSSAEGEKGGNGTATVLESIISENTYITLASAGCGFGGEGYNTNNEPSGGMGGITSYDSRGWAAYASSYGHIVNYEDGLDAYAGGSGPGQYFWSSNSISPITGYDNFEESVVYQFPAIGTYTSNFTSGYFSGDLVKATKIIQGAGAQSIYAPGDMIVCGEQSDKTIKFFKGHNSSVTKSTFYSSYTLEKSKCFGAGGRGGYSTDGFNRFNVNVKPQMQEYKGTNGAPGGVIIKW